jgi:hypothetical protein
MLPTRQLVRGGVNSSSPSFISAALGGLGPLSLDRVQVRQVYFPVCYDWIHIFMRDRATFQCTLIRNDSRVNHG